MTRFEFELLPVTELKVHEKTFSDRVQRIKKEILKSELVLTPLWIDKKRRIVLNGHHRLAALKELGCARVPVLLIDYDSCCVTVGICSAASISSINKSAVIEAAISGPLFPPRSSLHSLNFTPPNFSVPLSALKEQIRK